MEHEVFVCGRLCLVGEHSDWAGAFRASNPSIPPGKCVVVGTSEGLHATARPLADPVLRITCTSHLGAVVGPVDLPLVPAALLHEAQSGGFLSYVAGTAYRLLTAHHIGGLELVNHASTLPMSKGLSSSAAICVMVARAFNRVYDLKLTVRGEMEMAYLGEITTPSKCGRMDQACAFGSIPILLTFDGDLLHVEPITLKAPLHLVLVDLKAAKDTTAILTSLQAAYPVPQNAQHEQLHQLLGPVNEHITSQVLQALAAGDLDKLGWCLCEAQRQFDAKAQPLCPDQLTAPVLHSLLSDPRISPLLYGAKGVGSQGDGAAQLLCRGAEAQAQVCRIVEEELGMTAMPLTVSPT
ncbi:ribosomal protein S5 domain 2-type protein [Haematococcus lacustris]